MDDDLTKLLSLMDTLGVIARNMHPHRLDALVGLIGEQDSALGQAVTEPWRQAAKLVLEACAGLRACQDADNPMIAAYRAMRHYSQAQEALAELVDTVPEVGRYLLEPEYRDDPALSRRLAAPAGADTGIFHCGNETGERGGYSVFVPSWYDPARPMPLVMALHGGSGHGRLFLWNWLPEARSRGMIVVAPTAIGSTWSLMQPEIDSLNLDRIVAEVRGRWNIDAGRMLLTGMSDGGTFTLLSGLGAESPFTHLAPVAASFHPLLLAVADPERIAGLPIHLTHGARDWMFPVGMAQTAYRMLAAAGAAVVYREIGDLSHAYPRDGQGEVLDWFL
jgi:phospholipase/carboxylesterase